MKRFFIIFLCICSQVIGNQKNNYINFHKKGLIIKLGDALKMDIKRIKEKLKLIEKKKLCCQKL